MELLVVNIDSVARSTIWLLSVTVEGIAPPAPHTAFGGGEGIKYRPGRGWMARQADWEGKWGEFSISNAKFATCHSPN